MQTGSWISILPLVKSDWKQKDRKKKTSLAALWKWQIHWSSRTATWRWNSFTDWSLAEAKGSFQLSWNGNTFNQRIRSYINSKVIITSLIMITYTLSLWARLIFSQEPCISLISALISIYLSKDVLCMDSNSQPIALNAQMMGNISPVLGLTLQFRKQHVTKLAHISIK